MTTMGAFSAFFNIEGNAEEKLARIRSGAEQLTQTAVRTAASVQQVGVSLQAAGQVGLAGGDTNASIQAIALGKSLESLGISGRFTSSQLEMLSRQMRVVAASAGVSMAPALQLASSETLTLAANLRLSEQAARDTTMKFQFMGDVSSATALKMRMLSSSAQGLMLGLSILQGNLIGIGFSLIFLQFSGFLKTSLAIAAFTLAAGGAQKAISKFLSHRKEAEQLARSFRVITGSVSAAANAEERAKDIAEQLGLAQGDTTEITKALTEAQRQLEHHVEDISPKNLLVFANAWLIAKNEGKSAEEAIAIATQTMLGFAQSTDKSTVSILDATISMEVFKRRGADALIILRDEVRKNEDEVLGLGVSTALTMLGMGKAVLDVRDDVLTNKKAVDLLDTTFSDLRTTAEIQIGERASYSFSVLAGAISMARTEATLLRDIMREIGGTNARGPMIPQSDAATGYGTRDPWSSGSSTLRNTRRGNAIGTQAGTR
jgi:hypothetical protein